MLTLSNAADDITQTCLEKAIKCSKSGYGTLKFVTLYVTMINSSHWFRLHGGVTISLIYH